MPSLHLLFGVEHFVFCSLHGFVEPHGVHFLLFPSKYFSAFLPGTFNYFSCPVVATTAALFNCIALPLTWFVAPFASSKSPLSSLATLTSLMLFSRGCRDLLFLVVTAHITFLSPASPQICPAAKTKQVFEQVATEEVRRFSGEKTVAEARLSHGSVLLFRSAQEAPTWPPRPTPEGQAPAKPATVPAAAAMSSVVPFNTAAAAAAAAAMSAHAAVTHAPKPLLPARKGIDAAVAAASAVVVGNSAPAPIKVAAPSSAAVPAVVGSAPPSAASAAAAAVTPVDQSPSSPSSSSSSSPSVLPTSPLLQLPARRQEQAPLVASNGLATNETHHAAMAAKTESNGSTEGSGKNAPGWDGGHMAAAAAAAAVAGAAGTTPVVMNAEAQKRATYLALFQVGGCRDSVRL